MSVTTRNGQAQGGDLFSAKKLSRRERKALYAPVKETDRTRRPRTSTEPERAAGPLGWDIPGGGKASSIPQPVEFRGDWARVRVSIPGSCVEPKPERPTVHEGWIRWRSRDRGPWVWYYPKGC